MTIGHDRHERHAVVGAATRRRVRPLGAAVALGGLALLLGAGIAVLREEPGYVLYVLALLVGFLAAVLTLGATVVAFAGRPPSAATNLARAGALAAGIAALAFLATQGEHLEFGEGDVDVPATLAALVDIGYTGLVSVELSRHSHAAPAVAERSLAVLRAGLDTVTSHRVRS